MGDNRRIHRYFLKTDKKIVAIQRYCIASCKAPVVDGARFRGSGARVAVNCGFGAQGIEK